MCKSVSSDKCNPHPKLPCSPFQVPGNQPSTFCHIVFYFSGFSVSGIRVVGCLCLLSFSRVSVAFISSSLLFVEEHPIPSYGHSTAPLSSPLDIWFFPVLITVNKTIVNIQGQVLCGPVFQGVGLRDRMVSTNANREEADRRFLKWLFRFACPSAWVRGPAAPQLWWGQSFLFSPC